MENTNWTDQLFVNSIINYFLSVDKKEQDDIIHKLNVLKVQENIDPKLKKEYNAEFDDLYDDIDAEDAALEEIDYLTGREDLGSIERLKYLTEWFDAKVAKGLFESRN